MKWMKWTAIGSIVLMSLGVGTYFNGFHSAPQDGGLTINSVEIPVTVKVELRGPDGTLKEVRESHNRITNVGLQDGLNRMLSTGTLVANYIALETGNCTIGSTAFTDTALTTEVGTRQQDTSVTISSPTGGQRTGQLSVTFAAGNPATSAAVCGVGLFTALTGPDMFLRTTFAVVNKGTGDALTVTINVNLTAS